MSKVVTQALLHGPIFVPGVGQLSNQLSSTSDRSGKLKDLKMTLEHGSQILDVMVNKDVYTGIPLANIQILTFAPDLKPAASKTPIK